MHVRLAIQRVLAILMIAGTGATLAQATPPSAGDAAVAKTASAPRGAPLVINNRTVFVFRGSAFGAAP